MSVFARAFSVTGDEAYMEGARAALAPMLTPMTKSEPVGSHRKGWF